MQDEKVLISEETQDQKHLEVGRDSLQLCDNRLSGRNSLPSAAYGCQAPEWWMCDALEFRMRTG
jgi:hypothetical protein